MDTQEKSLCGVVILSFIFFLVIFFVFTGACRAEEVSGNILGRILCIKGIAGTDTLYVGTEDGLYKTPDAGGTWKKIALPGGVFHVSDIAIRAEDIFIAAASGVCVSASGGSWEWLPGTRGVKGVVVCSGMRTGDAVLAWSRKEIFLIKSASLERVGPVLVTEPIEDVACRDGNMFVTSGANIYRSSDGGKVWNRITLLRGYGEEGTGETNGIEETDVEFPVVGNIDSSGPECVAVATVEGIVIIGNDGCLKRKIATTGLPEAYLRYITYAGEDFFAATGKRVFLYSDKCECWLLFFEKTFPGEISFLEGHIDSKGSRRLWIAGGRYLYRKSIDFPPGDEAYRARLNAPYMLAGENKDENVKSGPTIRDVHKMAIEYAEVSPEKIKKWRSGARWKAILPRLSLGFSESVDDNIEIYKNSTTAYVVTGPRERDNDWGIDLTWDLSDLVWNDAQTNIDVRSKLMVQLRDDILEEVTRLYFERKRLIAEVGSSGLGSLDQKEVSGKGGLFEKRMRIEELTAYIDALTGGRFSKTIKAGTPH